MDVIDKSGARVSHALYLSFLTCCGDTQGRQFCPNIVHHCPSTSCYNLSDNLHKVKEANVSERSIKSAAYNSLRSARHSLAVALAMQESVRAGRVVEVE
jgi:hypothetical protein